MYKTIIKSITKNILQQFNRDFSAINVSKVQEDFEVPKVNTGK